MILGAFKLIEKVLHIIFLEFLNFTLMKRIYVVVFSLYFILIVACVPLGEFTLQFIHPFSCPQTFGVSPGF